MAPTRRSDDPNGNEQPSTPFASRSEGHGLDRDLPQRQAVTGLERAAIQPRTLSIDPDHVEATRRARRALRESGTPRQRGRCAPACTQPTVSSGRPRHAVGPRPRTSTKTSTSAVHADEIDLAAAAGEVALEDLIAELAEQPLGDRFVALTEARSRHAPGIGDHPPMLRRQSARRAARHLEELCPKLARETRGGVNPASFARRRGDGNVPW